MALSFLPGIMGRWPETVNANGRAGGRDKVRSQPAGLVLDRTGCRQVEARSRNRLMDRLLIANRGEIALRIARSAAEMQIPTLAVYPPEDAQSTHRHGAERAVPLAGRGAGAYLDGEQLIRIAGEEACDAIHPGYGFLSEDADFAKAVAEAGVTFVGPSVDTLRRLGDKAEARNLAESCGLPVLRGSAGAVTLDEAQEFLASLKGAPAMLKAVAGGGGRGLRLVRCPEELAQTYQRCALEARAAFGKSALYIEEYLANARHVEVQLLGDGETLTHLWERECSLQRRRQKLLEAAPCPNLPAPLREALLQAALSLGRALRYRSLGTVEFLLSGDRFVFMEANARLQVEHTVTEEITGIDLVAAQLAIADGASLESLGLTQAQRQPPSGVALQARINAESLAPDGAVQPASGMIQGLEWPTGPGIRIDAGIAGGSPIASAFDSLVAKLIVQTQRGSHADAVAKLNRALAETRVEGIASNLSFLRALTQAPEIAAGAAHIGYIDENLPALLEAAAGLDAIPVDKDAASLAGARVNAEDPLAVLAHGKAAGGQATPAAPRPLARPTEPLAPGIVTINAPMQGTLLAFEVGVGDSVWRGRPVAVMDAMKMEHEVAAEVSGVVQRISAEPGDTVHEAHPLIYLSEADISPPAAAADAAEDLDRIRPDLAEVLARKAAGQDAQRPEAVAKRRRTGHRTARENIADLCDPDSFVEYGSVVVAGQRRRRQMDDLIRNTTGDGMVCGLGRINGHLFSPEQARAMVMSYDYMVLAGTQGIVNHAKKDRLFEVAAEQRLPTVLFAEGGGGRPGDTDGRGVAGLDCWAFTYFARLSGLAPLIGITTGRCFAGNAVLLACCDVIIATEGANIGIGGPAMVEGGGLGVFRPDDIGPLPIQTANGVVDIAVRDEAEAVQAAKQYLSYFQGPVSDWRAPDARKLRFVVPENRLRYYDMRRVIEGIADLDSVLHLRLQWGPGLFTALIRVAGRPLGVIANNPGHLSGAIDSEAADKGARFLQLCDAFDLPVLSLCDCPGIMVGPESEKTALVRHAARMFVVGANVRTPLMTIITRKAYGLGAQAMAGGSFKAPLFCVSWPTGEFGGMGLEGAVKLGYRKELQAISDPAERQAAYEQMVADMYQRGKAVNTASHFEVDEVIDPADSRRWISAALDALPPTPVRSGKKRPNIDTW